LIAKLKDSIIIIEWLKWASVILDNAVAYFEAKVVRAMDAGDHTIFVGEVTDADGFLVIRYPAE
jgi:hypothetical protein